jgi:uncharacterized membrane protein
MNWSIFIIIATQLLFTASDLLARTYMSKQGFVLATFFSAWFLVYFLIRIIAMFGQLYVFTVIELGKTMALFGAVSIMLANLLGFLVLKEVLSTGAYIGITLAVIAFVVLAFT